MAVLYIDTVVGRSGLSLEVTIYRELSTELSVCYAFKNVRRACVGPGRSRNADRVGAARVGNHQQRAVAAAGARRDRRSAAAARTLRRRRAGVAQSARRQP